MSQAAYELLLQANDWLAKGNREGAIQAYREVLRMDPTPQQRQVAEEQLRVMGNLPYTFSTSGKVIRKSATRPSGEIEREHRPPREERRVERPQPSPPVTPARVPSPYPNSSSPLAGTSPWASRPQPPPVQPANVPLTRSEKILSVLDNLFKPNAQDGGLPDDVEEEQPNYRVGKRTPPVVKRRREEEDDQRFNRIQPEPNGNRSRSPSGTPNQRPPRDRQGALDELDRTVFQKGKKPVKEEKQTDSRPKPPRPRANESQESFDQRVQRYRVWLKYRERHPHIDVNVACRMEEEGWTLKQFREYQQAKKRAQSKKRKQVLLEKLAQNATYPGAEWLDAWTQTKSLIWAWGFSKPMLQGRLMEVMIFDCVLRGKSRKKRRVHKLDLQAIAPLYTREVILSNTRVDEEAYAAKQRPATNREERPPIDAEELEKHIEKENFIYLGLNDGSWFKCFPTWLDPYNLGVRLICEENPHEEEIEFLVFRHAITKIYRRKPTNWAKWPLGIDFLPQKNSEDE